MLHHFSLLWFVLLGNRGKMAEHKIFLLSRTTQMGCFYMSGLEKEKLKRSPSLMRATFLFRLNVVLCRSSRFKCTFIKRSLCESVSLSEALKASVLTRPCWANQDLFDAGTASVSTITGWIRLVQVPRVQESGIRQCRSHLHVIKNSVTRWGKDVERHLHAFRG